MEGIQPSRMMLDGELRGARPETRLMLHWAERVGEETARDKIKIAVLRAFGRRGTILL